MHNCFNNDEFISLHPKKKKKKIIKRYELIKIVNIFMKIIINNNVSMTKKEETRKDVPEIRDGTNYF